MQDTRTLSELAPVVTLEQLRKDHLSEHTNDYMSSPGWTLAGKWQASTAVV